ncbi:hypothetical protein PPYR_15676 [Photinus pyralis]|uniref:Uncharacterized protein n=1 Tax=Photinus pyralis TaxID=7054 RepID=A0A5N3ZY86_PHOPY|nr:hypothetical protein PPYR_15676 [Photinus pyralis]
MIKANLTRFKNYIESIKDLGYDENTLVQLKLRLVKIEPCLEKFNDLEAEIELSEGGEVDEDERYSF